jgi:hypothetical protein
MADTSLLPGLDVAWVCLGSLGGAVATVLAAWSARAEGDVRAGWHWWVTAGDAWTAGDSWLTNITVVTGVLTSMWSRLTFSGGVLSAGSPDATVFVLFLLFTAAAALAPVIYAACAAGGSGAAGESVTGTAFGYLLAATAVLLGTFGMMATLAVFVWDALTQTPATRAIVLPFLGLGAALTAVYAFRTITAVLRHHATAPGTAPPSTPSPTPSSSFLVGSRPSRRSATL